MVIAQRKGNVKNVGDTPDPPQTDKAVETDHCEKWEHYKSEGQSGGQLEIILKEAGD